MPQLPDDDARYRANAEYEQSDPACTFQSSEAYEIADPESDYWKIRDLAQHAKGIEPVE